MAHAYTPAEFEVKMRELREQEKRLAAREASLKAHEAALSQKRTVKADRDAVIEDLVARLERAEARWDAFQTQMPNVQPATSEYRSCGSCQVDSASSVSNITEYRHLPSSHGGSAEIRVLYERDETPRRVADSYEACRNLGFRSPSDRVSPNRFREAPVREALNSIRDEFAYGRSMPRSEQNTRDYIGEQRQMRRELSLDRATSQELLRECIATVPSFDGTNVFKFVTAIRQIQEQIPADLEREVNRRLKLKLTKAAPAMFGRREYETIDGFIRRLLEVFGTSLTSHYYRQQLGEIKKGNNEPMTGYIYRVSELHTALLDCTRIERRTDYLSDVEHEQIEREVIANFLDGLPEHLTNRIRVEPVNVEELYRVAVQIENEFAKKNRRYNGELLIRESQRENRGERSNRAQQTSYRPPQHPNLCRDEPRITRNDWRDRAYVRDRDVEREIPRAETQTRRENTRAQSPRREGARLICSYCSKPGHDLEHCYMRQNRERNASGNAQGARRFDGPPANVAQNRR